NGDYLGKLRFGGYDGSILFGNASVSARATEDWSTTARGTSILFNTVENGSTISQPVMWLNHNTNVGIGTSNPIAKLDVFGGQIRMSTGATNGYIIQGDGKGVMSWVDPGTLGIGVTLDEAYDQGGAGAGRSIDAVDGTVTIKGEDGLVVTGTFGNGLAIGDLGGIPAGFGGRMFFYPRKRAFRSGFVSGTQWDDINVGNYSSATGNNTTASGSSSTAMGNNTTASGSNSTVMGNSTTASGSSSTAMGYNSTASGSISIAMGNSTTASGIYSTAMGMFTSASGSSSTAIGSGTRAPSYTETAIGSYNTTYTPASATSWNSSDRLFVVGNGTNSSARSDAMVILKNGNVGVGTSTPTNKLDVDGQIRMRTGATNGYIIQSNANGVMSWVDPSSLGAGVTLDQAYDNGGAGAGRTIDAIDGTVAINGQDGLLVSGTFDSGLAIGDEGGIPEVHGVRMFFNPKKAAFRAGSAIGTQWYNENVGVYSFATGANTTASGGTATATGSSSTASGTTSTAMGSSTTASGNNSTAMGLSTTASGSNSTAMGSGTTASALASTAMGWSTTASGNRSTAMGNNTTSPSYAETAIGNYNTTYTPAGASSWNSSDRLFVVGNGTSSSSRSDAMVILKNGNIGIGTSSPTNSIHIKPAAGAGMLVERLVGSPSIVAGGTNDWMVIDGKLTTNGNVGLNIYSSGDIVLGNGGGNTGIGIMTPAYKLHVNGSAGKPGGGSWSAASDARLKENVVPYTEGLSQLLQIKPVRYHYNKLSGNNTKVEYIGVIAQELQKVAPYMVGSFDLNGTKYLDVDNSAMTYMLINAVQEQQKMIEQQQSENKELQLRLERMESIVNELLKSQRKN
ncbi:MAG: tail fiber domain-containing protein, partial [Bacteroidia bacterium]